MGCFDLLRRPDYRRLWLGNMSGNFAALLQLMVSTWIMVQMGASQTMITLTQAAATLPLVLGAFPVGVLSDLCNQRSLMLGAQICLLLTSSAFALCAAFGLLTPWLVLGLTFLIGCGQTFNTPVWYGTIRTLVPHEELPEALSLNSTAFNLVRCIGPAASGVILSFGGNLFAYLLAIVLNVALLLAVLRWRSQDRRSIMRGGYAGALREGLRYFFASPIILHSSLRTMLFTFSGSAILALLPIIAAHEGGGTALLYGILLACFGAGATLTTFVSAWLLRRISFAHITVAAFLAFALAALLLADFRWIPLCGVGLMLAGGAWLCVLSQTNARIQMLTPAAVSGRIATLYLTALYLGMTLGSSFWGMVSDAMGPARALQLSAVTLLLTLALLRPRRNEFAKAA